jgi:hypothetical protein
MPLTTYIDPENVTSVVSSFDYANTVTGAAFTPAIIFVVWLILFITLKQWRTEAALTSSLFITMMITVLLRMTGLVTDTIMVVVIVAFLASIFMVVLGKEEYN